MDEPRWSLQDAKNRFSTVVAAAVSGQPQTVTKHGKPAVVVLSFADYERLTGRKPAKKPSFVEHLLNFPKGGSKFERLRVKPRDVKF